MANSDFETFLKLYIVPTAIENIVAKPHNFLEYVLFETAGISAEY